METVLSNKSVKTENHKKTVFEIYKEPLMTKALGLIPSLCSSKEITLKAKGNSITNAVSIANIITNNLLKGKAKISKATVDSDPLVKMGSLLSTIEIVLTIEE